MIKGWGVVGIVKEGVRMGKWICAGGAGRGLDGVLGGWSWWRLVGRLALCGFGGK